MKNKFNRKRGFTLIELLVVISIISLLSTIVLASLNDARYKARNTQILQGAYELRNAIELFHSDNGYYPGQNDDYDDVYYAYKSLEADGSYSYGHKDIDDIDSLLGPYLKEVLKSPIVDQEYGYWHKAGDRCFGDLYAPEYTIYLERNDPTFELNLPGYTDGNEGIPGEEDTNYYCISSPK